MVDRIFNLGLEGKCEVLNGKFCTYRQKFNYFYYFIAIVKRDTSKFFSVVLQNVYLVKYPHMLT